MWDLDERVNKLFKFYESKLELSKILLLTSIVAGLLIIVFTDNKEVIINNNTYYQQFLEKKYRDSILIFTIVYLFGLYIFKEKDKIKL